MSTSTFTMDEVVELLRSTEGTRGIVALIGQIQRWQELGAFGDRQPGRGRARTFTMGNLQAVCVLNELAKIGVSRTAAVKMVAGGLTGSTDVTLRHTVGGATITVSTKHYAPGFAALMDAKRAAA